MLSNIIVKYRRFALLLACSALLVSCDRILTPGFETSVQDLRGYRVQYSCPRRALSFYIGRACFNSAA